MQSGCLSLDLKQILLGRLRKMAMNLLVLLPSLIASQDLEGLLDKLTPYMHAPIIFINYKEHEH